MDLKKVFLFFKNYVPDDYFTWLDISFKLEGFLPPKERYKKFLYNLIFIPQIYIIRLIAYLFEWITVYSYTNEDIKMKMLFLSLVIFDTIIIFRLISFVVNKSQLEKIKSIIRRSSFNFDCFRIVAIDYKEAVNISKNEKLSLSSVWKKVKPVFMHSSKLEQYRIEIMFKTRLLCTTLYLSLVGICLMTVIIWQIEEAHAETYQSFNPYLNKTSTYRKFQMKLYLPFDTSFDGYYWLGYIIQVYYRFTLLMSFLPIENILVSSIIHLIGQTMVIIEAFKHIDKNIFPNQNSKNVFLIKHIRLVKCINELQEIYKAIEMLEKLCSFQMIVQYGLATFLLCTLTYVFPMVKNLTELYCCLIFLIASLGEIFIFSYICQSLSLELQEVAKSLYNIDWPFYPLTIKKHVVFLLKRLQKPAYLTAGNFFIIDLQFFIQIIQRAYSFYTLISNTRNV